MPELPLAMLFHPSVEETFHTSPLLPEDVRAAKNPRANIRCTCAPRSRYTPRILPDARTPTATVHPAIGYPHHPLTFREAAGQLS